MTRGHGVACYVGWVGRKPAPMTATWGAAAAGVRGNRVVTGQSAYRWPKAAPGAATVAASARLANWMAACGIAKGKPLFDDRPP